MFLAITTTYQPATDLGHLLHKHPTRAQTHALPFGQAHIFYAEAQTARCTAVLLLDVDPVRLVRRQRGEFALSQYVNDRPYAASSFLSTAIAQVYGSALNGRSRERQALADSAIPLQARIAAVPARGGGRLLHQLFEPLGYEVEAQGHALDARFPEWGASRYFTVTLRGEKRLAELLTHLYVLAPVLDDDKHYYVGEDEIEKLMQRGEGWLAAHPYRDLIVRRYLKHRRALVQEALGQLVEEEETAADPAQLDEEEALVEAPLNLHEQRLQAVLEALKESGATRALDLGCGEGRLLQRLANEPQFREIVGVDVSVQALERAAQRLKGAAAQRVTLLQSALTYCDRRLAGYEAAALVEVIEHIEPGRLPALERAVFEAARPQTVVVTTPNAEYNALFPSLPAGRFRHRDHRFEWTREEFRQWAEHVAGRFGYRATLQPIGPVNEAHGSPSQMAVFQREETS